MFDFYPGLPSDVQVCHQRLSSAFDLLLIFLCSLIQTLTLTPPPNNALLANMDMWHIHSSPMATLLTLQPAVSVSAYLQGAQCQHALELCKKQNKCEYKQPCSITSKLASILALPNLYPTCLPSVLHSSLPPFPPPSSLPFLSPCLPSLPPSPIFILPLFSLSPSSLPPSFFQYLDCISRALLRACKLCSGLLAFW